MKRKRLVVAFAVSLIVILCLAGVTAATPNRQGSQPVGAGIYRGVSTAAQFDVSPPLRSIKPLEVKPNAAKEIPDRPTGLEGPLGPQEADAALQTAYGPPLIPAPSVSFNGPNNISNVSPPDPVGDVGPNHYVAMSNLSFQIFDKVGNSLFGPALNNTLWAGFGGPCQTENAGDPIVIYDQLDDRWILTQFTAAGPTYYNCVAVSTTGDPTGTYYRYAFSTGSNFPDYPKYGMWPDALYISTREFAGSTFVGIGAYAINRAQLIAGNPAAQVVSFLATAASAGGAYNIGDGLLPTDLDGGTLPAAGTPNFFVGSMDNGASYGAPQDALTLWKFHVDFVTPANSTFLLANTIPIAAIDTIPAFCSGRVCVPQPGTTNKIDHLGYRQRPLWRLAYRNFGSHESLVTNQSVEASATMSGIRWWEIRSPNSSPFIFQEGTYAPGLSDGIHRWMGSIAMDRLGNMALGYSASDGVSTFPSVWYTGRLVADPLGTMPQGEGSIFNGTGSQTSSNRWGDYTSMNVDPVDDCTFWYVNEYLPTTSGNGWRLRIGAFAFPQCNAAPDFTLSAAPAATVICAPNSAAYTVTVGSVFGFANPVTLSVPVPPANTTASFSVNPVTPVGSSVLTIGNTGAATAGNYTIDVVGVYATRTHTTTVGLNLFTAAPSAPALVAPANGATGISTQPIFTWTASSQAVNYTFEIATDANFNNLVHSATGLTGTTYSGVSLNTSTTYYWRVRPANVCGAGGNSAVFNFRTQTGPGDCSEGFTPNILYNTNFESGAGGWTHNAATGSDTWALTSANPHSGSTAWHADDVATVSDQRLTSPAVALPAGQNPVVLRFWNWQHMETRTNGCFDGGILEVSSNGGVTWTQVVAPNLLTDPYDGPVAANYGNPLANLNAWCGNNPQPYVNSIVDVSAYAGQTVQFRFRMGTDSSSSRPGWNIDDVTVQSCRSNLQPSFTGVDVAPGALSEDEVIQLTGTFTNPNPPGVHTVTVNWGDGLTETLPVLSAGVYAFTATHQYLDDNPTGTAADLNSISLALGDNLGNSVITSTSVLIYNVPPEVDAGPDQSALINTASQLTGGFIDLGTLDTHTIAWNFGDGSASTGTLAPWHTYTQTGVYTATLTITDDDTGTDNDFLVITVAAKVYLPLILRSN